MTPQQLQIIQLAAENSFERDNGVIDGIVDHWKINSLVYGQKNFRNFYKPTVQDIATLIKEGYLEPSPPIGKGEDAFQEFILTEKGWRIAFERNEFSRGKH